jgi:hypothetical protein
MSGWLAARSIGCGRPPSAVLSTNSLPYIGRIAEGHSGLRLTIDHLGGRGGNTTLGASTANSNLRSSRFGLSRLMRCDGERGSFRHAVVSR